MKVYLAMFAALLAVLVVGGITLMPWSQECRVVRDRGLTLWDASDPACRHLANQEGRQ